MRLSEIVVECPRDLSVRQYIPWHCRALIYILISMHLFKYSVVETVRWKYNERHFPSPIGSPIRGEANSANEGSFDHLLEQNHDYDGKYISFQSSCVLKLNACFR